jgi:hypothetical protein
MEEIVLTYQPEMSTAWFLEFLDMIVSCNPNRRITVLKSDFLIRHFANGVIAYVFRGVHISHALFISELTRWTLERKAARERERVTAESPGFVV